MSGVSRLSHFTSRARSSSSLSSTQSSLSLSSSLLPTTPRGRGCSSITTTLAQQRLLLQQHHQPVQQQQQQQQSFRGGGGGRFKSTTAAPARLKKSSNESSSLSLVSSFWDAAASTIQSGLSTSVHQSSLYFQTLRWKAANALMTSLSDSERQQLLQRLDILPTTTTTTSNNSNGMNLTAGAANQGVEIMENKSTSSTSTTVVLSVAEAVAAARVQEAMRSSSSIAETSTTTKSAAAAAAAQHREELWRQAQQAAHARVATEITALQQHLEKEAAASNANDNAANVVEKECSILGPVVYDLGYKRCHVVSACQLTSIPVWERQRSYRHDRAKNMAKDKLKTLHLGMPGVISLHEDLQGNLSILDGQHRVGMMAILAEEMQQQQQDANNSKALDLTRILVEVYPERACAPNGATTTSNSDSSSSSSHAADLFVEINKAEPVKLVDLPGMGAKKSEANVINQGAHLVQERFPEMFSASQRCRCPHLNLDNLRDALFQASVVTRAKLKSPKALEMWLLEQNDVLKQKYSQYQSDNNNANGGEEKEVKTSSWSISKAALEKARKYDFYLGLETSWLSK